jgi:hypothetical protein
MITDHSFLAEVSGRKGGYYFGRTTLPEALSEKGRRWYGRTVLF